MAIKVDRDGNVLSESNFVNKESKDFHLYFIKGDNYFNYWMTSETTHLQRITARVRREKIQNAVVEFVGTFTGTEKSIKQIKNDFIKENILDKGFKVRWQEKLKKPAPEEE